MPNADTPIHINAPHLTLGSQDVYRIIGGDALGVIERIGWETYRTKLEELSWDPFANTQIHVIQTLRKNPNKLEAFFSNKPDRTRVEQQIFSYMEQARKRFPKDGSQPYFAHPAPEGGARGNKLIMEGKRTPPYGNEKTTRVYMAISTDKLVQAFELLRSDFAAHGILDEIVLAMNLETLDNPDIGTADNNAIIAYIPDSNSAVLTKLCAAVKRVKLANPTPFALSSEQEATVRAIATSEFFVPLDNTTWFIEQEKERHGRSYHTGTFAEMRTSIYWGKKPLVERLPNLVQYRRAVSDYKREGIEMIPNEIPVFAGKRRLAMPGLVAVGK